MYEQRWRLRTNSRLISTIICCTCLSFTYYRCILITGVFCFLHRPGLSGSEFVVANTFAKWKKLGRNTLRIPWESLLGSERRRYLLFKPNFLLEFLILHQKCRQYWAKPNLCANFISFNSFVAGGNFCHLLIIFINSLDWEQDLQSIRPNLDSNRLTLWEGSWKNYFGEKNQYWRKKQQMPTKAWKIYQAFLIWIQTVWHSNSVPERMFISKKLTDDNKSMKNLPSMQRVNPLPHREAF